MENQKKEKIFIDGEWYILCTSVPYTSKKLTLKDNRSFLITDAYGDIPVAFPTELGFYHKDTRYLSKFEVTLSGFRPLLLYSGLSNDGKSLQVELTNVDFKYGETLIPRTSLYIKKEISLINDTFFLKLKVRNLTRYILPVELEFMLGADFLDIFEIRGMERTRRGKLLPVSKRKGSIIYRYCGLDGIERVTNCVFSPTPDVLSDDMAKYRISLESHKELEISLCIAPERISKRKFFLLSEAEKKPWPLSSDFEIEISDDVVNAIFNRSKQDIGLMISDVEGEKVVFAGIPWYCAIFGRDSLLTAYEMLPWLPELAKGTLKILAKYQAKDFDDFTDSEPGKILHELREGEMAKTREVPFIPYYGSVDATALFVILAWEYLKVTGDRAFIKEIWDNIVMASAWLEKYGDLDGDGFLEYITRSPLGLRNQGWKDSHDAIHHKNGELAEPPIAVVEAQGYKYMAYLALSEMCFEMGDLESSKYYEAAAARLRERFNRLFWMEDEQYYCIALDKEKRQCKVISSNPGHCLFSGIIFKKRAHKVVKRLMGSEMFSGYGIRTLSEREFLYNPMSYHNGSIWPHDCAIIAEGMVKYGYKTEALKVFKGILEAVSFFQDYRVPELFCGFKKEKEKGPVPYPVACSPQAWSAASVFLMLKTFLGLKVAASEKCLYLVDPVLPYGVDELIIKDWCLFADVEFSLRFLRSNGKTTVEALKKPKNWKVVIIVE